MPTPPHLEVRRLSGETVVRFVGLNRLDEHNSHAPRKELSRLAERLTACRLVLDLANICFVTGSALGWLVGLNRRVRSAGGRLVLANLRPAVAEVLAVTHLDRVLEVRPTLPRTSLSA